MRTYVATSLHDEHMATLRLIEGLEALLGQHGPATPPAVAEAPAATVLRDLERAVALEIGPHFHFEEAFLFPRFIAAGEQEMVALLLDEHAEIRPLALRLAELAQQCRDVGFTQQQWAAFSTAGADFAARLVSHIEKEEMAMLPALDDLLDAETDGALSLALADLR